VRAFASVVWSVSNLFGYFATLFCFCCPIIWQLITTYVLSVISSATVMDSMSMTLFPSLLTSDIDIVLEPYFGVSRRLIDPITQLSMDFFVAASSTAASALQSLHTTWPPYVTYHLWFFLSVIISTHLSLIANFVASPPQTHIAVAVPGNIRSTCVCRSGERHDPSVLKIDTRMGIAVFTAVMGMTVAAIPREWGQRLRYTRGNGNICCLPNDSRSQAWV